MMPRPLRRPRRLVVAMLLGAVVVGGGLAAAVAGGLLLHDSAKPASVADAIARFRGTGSRIGGVYVYATRGGESVSAVVSAHHDYPARTGLMAAPTACGLRLRWQALQGRSTSWTLCHTRLGLELRVVAEAHRFFGQNDQTTYSCTGAVVGPVSGASNDRPFRCRSDRGREAGQLQVFGREQVEVGGRAMTAVHSRSVGRVAGGDFGTETMDWWLEPGSGLPLKIVLTSRTSRPLPIGRARYREDVTLRLVSTIPRR
jgi:hypothetical protein